MKSFCLIAGLCLAQAATAEQWFMLTRPGPRAEVQLEVDLDSVHHHASGGEAVLRATFALLRPHASGYAFRSVVATAHLDCRRNTISLASAAYFALPTGEGPRVGADSAGRDAGMPPDLLESLPAAGRRALLRATCATAPRN